MIFLLVEYLVIFLIVAAFCIFIIDQLLRSAGHAGPMTDHFDGKIFKNLGSNIDTGEKKHGKWAVFRWMISRDKNVWVEAEALKSVPAMRVEGGRIVATFVGHATVLIQTENLNIITDPVYAQNAGPVSWLGPKRKVDPGVSFDDLPIIDVILLSHNHYDHLDIVTLRKLQEKYHPLVIVPLGNSDFLEKKGIKVAKELDWWDKAELSTAITTTAVKGIEFQLVPAQHFSARALSDRDKSLWGGYVMTTPHGDIYFAGDTGYGPFVKNIKQAFPKGFRFGLLPIGAYEPAWFMKPVHMSPDEALTMKKELGIRDAMAIHFGTFKLADDKQGGPEARLRELVAQDPAGAGNFIALMNGQSMEIKE